MIAKEAVQEYLAKDLDSFTWMKKLTREQLLSEFRAWRVRPHFKTDPWTHQLVCFYIGMCYPQFMFLLDMGLGKTKILLDIMTQRVRERKMKRALITVPRLINLGTWQDAIEEHSDLEPVLVSCSSKEEKWETLLNAKGQVVVIDYPGLQHALSKKVDPKKREKKTSPALVKDPTRIAKLARQYDFFGMDESHKAKNRETLRFQLLRALTRNMPARFGTTGTLFGRNPEDLFGQFQLIDGGETFGTTLGMFHAAYFTEKESRWKAYPDHVFNKAMTRALYRRLQHRSVRYSEEECLDLPPRREVQLRCRLPDEQRQHYLRALEGLINANGNLQELDSNFLRMRQIVAGFLQWKDETGKHEVTFRENPKLLMLERLLEECGDSKVVISHEYTRSGELVTELLTSMGIKYEWLHGGSKDQVNAVRRFMFDPDCQVFLMNSESGGTGTDGLQKVARYLIFYESPVSPITRQQVLKRVHRPGQERQSVIYDLIVERSVDMRVLSFIAEGRSLHSAIVAGTRSRGDLRSLLASD